MRWGEAERDPRGCEVERTFERGLDFIKGLAPGDRFIIRRPSPEDTVGGGAVVEIEPPLARLAAHSDFAPEALERAEARLEEMRGQEEFMRDAAAEIDALIETAEKVLG